ncbi:HNH endonuclease [Anaeromyxobacter sp. Fw109-5]|uniref:HNH endonuclease n=1 Tax=Anaeromyxobacter sp. (strain Fw109-5) TaxID=404589 RepID=UPI000158A4C2|nr:HNH endonuclease signature motif containing protein [Anaeromyxobacter sp. Fw109-5]ABS27271.1 HNH endonuclease [Anaeromyxobacter sp. Fw109-5]
MPAVAPSALDSTLLAQRLRELAGQERDVQVEFLLHLEVFDRRRAYVEAGYPSLWAYCLEVLHLREGAAGRRIQAMRVLRRFPSLEGALRDGRLCISTVQLLGQVLTEENLPDLVGRAAYRTKAEVDHLVASLQARTAPRAGLRKLPDRAPAASAPALPLATVHAGPAEPQEAIPAPPAAAGGSLPPTVSALPDVPRPKTRAETRAVSESGWSLRVTIDASCKEDLETLAALLSHKIPDGDLAAVLREAIRCAIEKHGKRKGAVAPQLQRQRKADRDPRPSAEPAAPTSTIPAIVRREVWKRDGGRCAWVAPDGRRCNSRWQLELDHIHPQALGGLSTLENLRVACRSHNLLHAEQTYGREHMDRFRRESASERTGYAGAAPAAIQQGLWAT